MIVRRKPRLRLVAHDGRDLARLWRTHQVHSFSPDGSARTGHPVHPRRVGNSPNRKISVDCFAHLIPRGGWFVYFATVSCSATTSRTSPHRENGAKRTADLRRPSCHGLL